MLQQTLAEGSTTDAGYRWFQGTSMATPHVAGAAALVMSLGVSSPAAVEDVLKSTASPAPESSKERYGAGLLGCRDGGAQGDPVVGTVAARIRVPRRLGRAAHARSIGQLMPKRSLECRSGAGLAVGAGALAMLAPLGAERIYALSFLALPPAAWPQRFLHGGGGLSRLERAGAVRAGAARRGSRHAAAERLRRTAAGLAFGWAGTLLHAAIWRTVDAALDAGALDAGLAARQRDLRLAGGPRPPRGSRCDEGQRDGGVRRSGRRPLPACSAEDGKRYTLIGAQGRAEGGEGRAGRGGRIARRRIRHRHVGAAVAGGEDRKL